MKKIFIASDHAGFEIKYKLVEHFNQLLEDGSYNYVSFSPPYTNHIGSIDLHNMMNYILNEFPIDSEYLWAADMDFTSELNVNDIIKLVSFILLP